MSRRRRVIGASVVALIVGVWGVAAWFTPRDFFFGNDVPARRRHPNVLLITLGATRADRLGSSGHAAAVTPNLDQIAASGVRFTRAVSPAPLTLPAHASLMTGRNPYAHGVRTNGDAGLKTDVPTLAERFAAAGYDTAAFVSTFALDRQFGLARGFAHYDDALDPPRGPVSSLELERRGDRTAQAAAAWLASHDATRPYFLWVHLHDAHEPYNPPASFRARFEDRPYDGEIAFQDAMVGELLAAAGSASGRAGAALMVVAGDHGESLGDHGASTHGLFVYDSTVRVPLLLSWPGVLQPRVVEPAVALADVAPTIAALTGLPVFDGVDGRSLRPLMEGAAPGGVRPVYAETYLPQFAMGWAPLRSVRDSRWKFIDAPEPELYDLTADPEQVNRFADQPVAAATLRRQLETLAGGHRAGPAPDPKRMVVLFEQLLDGNRALARGDGDQAARLARSVLATDAGNTFARLVLGRALLATGQHRDAIQALRTYLTAVPASADAHHWIALAHLRLDDRERALAEEEAALALDPRHGAALSLRAGLLAALGRKDAGVQSLATAVAADPLNVSLRVALADLLAEAGRAADAEAEYRRVLDARPGDVAARLGLGILLARTDRLEPAIAELTRVLELAPAEDEARFERAVAYERLGRTAEARAGFERLDAPATRPDIRQAAAARLARLRR